MFEKCPGASFLALKAAVGTYAQYQIALAVNTTPQHHNRFNSHPTSVGITIEYENPTG